MVAADLVASLLRGERRALARAISLVESRAPRMRDAATGVLRAALAHRYEGLSARSGDRTAPPDQLRIGISGPPGAGKSTLIDALGMELVSRGHKLAVLAVDPSSHLSGGSILGDKTRMPRLSAEPRAYVRPSPSRGALGGVGRRTADAIALCECAGFDRVIVETVGVGQSEVAVSHLVDAFVLLVPPGGGDELQGIKRGIMELADVAIVTKADGGLREPARQAARQLRSALKVLRPRSLAWSVPVLEVSSLASPATTGRPSAAVTADADGAGADRARGAQRGGQAAGVDVVADTLDDFFVRVRDSGELGERRHARAVALVREQAWVELLEAVNDRGEHASHVEELVASLASEVQHGARGVSDAARQVAQRIVEAHLAAESRHAAARHRQPSGNA